MPDIVRVNAIVRGRVQGVGFRYFTERRARSLRVVGYVRNRPDGNVEVEVEGPRQDVEALIGSVAQGPSGSRVDAVSTNARPVLGTESVFEVRY